jgi:hypothetical protein
MVDIASDDRLYPVVRTGTRGRPVNTGPRDFHHLYAMAQVLASDETLSQAEAARRVADSSDRTAWDRLPRKLRRMPHLLMEAQGRRERQVTRYIREFARRQVEVSMMGFRSKVQATAYVQILALVEPAILNDPRVVEAERTFWSRVRPSLVETLLDRYRQMDRLLGRVDQFTRTARGLGPWD